MSKKYRFVLTGLTLVLVSLSLIYFLGHDVSLTVDGQIQTLHTRALTVGGVLREAGIPVGPQDELSPSPQAWARGKAITLMRARQVQVWLMPAAERTDLYTTARTAGQILAEAGLTLAEADSLRLNGQPITTEAELPFPVLVLQLRRAMTIHLNEDGNEQTLQSSAETLGEALGAAGIVLHPADRLSLPLETPLTKTLDVSLHRAVPLTVQLKDKELRIFSAAPTVGAALAETGVSLQGLDISDPAEDEPLPAEGIIRVVRVSEEVVLSQSLIPFGKKFVEDPESELDQRSVVTAGSPGVLLSRERVRLADGVETARTAEAQWQVRAPVDEELGYGTKVVIRTLDTPDGPIEYWRAVTVYVTSYHPCGFVNPPKCSYITASGMQVAYGIIAVSKDWYSWTAGQRMYVPGYGSGVVADWGGGIPGEYWIDVAYEDANYVPWHYYRTIYFLTPVPDNIPWILP